MSSYIPLGARHCSHLRFVLPNGINVLLISDPTQETAACGLSVAVGHHSNREDTAGLAHFCEHMVCVSSKEFPETDLCKKLVYCSGGRWNAATVGEKTSFFFEVPAFNSDGTPDLAVYEEIVGVFSSCFRNPTFNKDYARREVMAIDSEHTKNCSVVGKMAHHGLRLLASPEHPFHRFSTGNFDTLFRGRKTNLHDELVQFYEQNYQAWKSGLVLTGPQSLNALKKLAIANFSECMTSQRTETSNVLETCWAPVYRSPVFTDLGKFVLIESANTTPTLRICFPFKTDSKDSLVFAHVWSYVMGSENEVSFNSELFKAGLIKGSYSSCPLITFKDRLLQLELNLTMAGTRDYEKIFDYLIRYTQEVFSPDPKRVKRAAKLMSQFNSIELYNFLHRDTELSASSQCRTLSQRLLEDQQIYSDWLFKNAPCWSSSDSGYDGSYEESMEAQTWWKMKSEQFCAQMRSTVCKENILATLVAPGDVLAHFGKQKYDVDPYYGFSYKILPITYCQSEFQVKLPRPNQFVVGQIDNQTGLYELLQSTLESSRNFVYAGKEETRPPELVHSSKEIQLWLKQDCDRYCGKAYLSFEITSASIEPSVQSTLSLEIFSDIVKELLREKLYPALELWYAYDLLHSMKGTCSLVIHVSGSTVGIYNILEIITNKLRELSDKFLSLVTPAMFRQSRIRIKMKYENLRTLRSHELASLGLLSVLEPGTWPLEDRLEILEELDIETVATTAKTTLESCQLTALLHGDVSMSNYQRTVDTLRTLVAEFASPRYKQLQTLSLPHGCNYRIHGFSPDETNALVYYIQLGARRNMRDRSLARFVAYILSTFLTAKIRTQYQLGYAVFAGLRTLKDTVGVHVTIMSGDHEPLDLDAKIDDIVTEWISEFEKSGSRYAEIFKQFIKSLNQPVNENSSLTFGVVGKSLGDGKLIKEHQNFWNQIINQSLSFSASGEDKIDVAVIESLPFSILIKYLKTKLVSEERSKLCVMLSTKLSHEEVATKLRPIRLQTFLTAAGLPIKREKLEQLLDQAGDSQAQLAKSLFKHYQEEGGSLRLISSTVMKLTRDVFARSKKTDFPRTSSTEIINLHSWKSHMQEGIAQN
ncbi:hypothetical protein KL942_003259 [Ogataea angusta]|uniref:Uncharacterized protein n=1 Tax=Pichia angusta TaxID=870730 RepID=A0ABQ7RW14_PICAN|nr:hypothetical protein KL942_003259 [Ogataea angusta]KAG7849281.1 hypothetical protein KL940_002963 [Ogataea angusta]